VNNNWHVFPQEQLKPNMVGEEVLLLGVGRDGRLSTSSGKRLRHSRIAGLHCCSILSHPFGIIIDGANRKGIEALLDHASTLWDCELKTPCLNQEVISKAKDLFLPKSAVPRNIDALSFCLVQGLTHLLPTFSAFPRIPITSLPKHPTSERGILIVEDDEAQLELFRLLLEQMGYSNILLAQNGNEALPILKARGGDIDLILLNWAMPGMDGLTMMQQLGASGFPHIIGVIMESGSPDTLYKNEFFSLGTNSILPIDYLVKPFLLEDFDLEIRVGMEFVRKRKLRSRAAS
jgi:CheY-like chemotaxis protein